MLSRKKRKNSVRANNKENVIKSEEEGLGKTLLCVRGVGQASDRSKSFPGKGNVCYLVRYVSKLIVCFHNICVHIFTHTDISPYVHIEQLV